MQWKNNYLIAVHTNIDTEKTLWIAIVKITRRITGILRIILVQTSNHFTITASHRYMELTQ